MKIRSILACLLVALLLAGCGASSGSYDKAVAQEAPAETWVETEMMMSNGMARDTLAESKGSGGQSSLPANRKFIINMNMEVETEDMDALLAGLDAHITSLGGYVQSRSVQNGSRHASKIYRYGDLTVRIPVERLNEFTQQVQELSNVTYSSQDTQDVTLQYVDTQSRVQALEVEQERLMELLAQAQDMSDLLEIENRLTEVRYELENYASRLRVLDNQIDFATIQLNISEVREYSPVEEPTRWQRVVTGFRDSLQGLGDGILDAGAWVLINSPYLVLWAVVIVLVVFGWRVGKRRGQERRRKAIEKQYQARMAQEKKEET